MTMTMYPVDEKYAAAHPDRCPVVTATASSSNGVRVCGKPLVGGFCPRHGLVEKPPDAAMEEIEP